MRNQPINKRLQEVKNQNRLSLFARFAWHKDIEKDTIREMNLDEKRLNDKCPHIRTIRGGDESMDMCDLVDKWCLIEHNYGCEIWDEIRLNKKGGK